MKSYQPTSDPNVHYCPDCGRTKQSANPADRCFHNCHPMPSLSQRAANLAHAAKAIVLNPARRTQEEQAYILNNYCLKSETGIAGEPCSHYNGTHCTHPKCGCNANLQGKFLNKLAWKSQSCPIGRW